MKSEEKSLMCPYDEYDSCGYNAIHYAAQRGDIQKIEQLVASGANILMCTRGKMRNVLHIAMIQGRRETAQFLAKKYPVLIDNEVFLEAIKFGQFGLVQYFLESNIQLSYDPPNLLHYIVAQVQPVVLDRLLQQFSARCDHDGNTLLHSAVNAYRPERFLSWKFMVKVITKQSSLHVDDTNCFGRAAIHAAIKIPAVFHEVANYGANLCIRDSQGMTLVHHWAISLFGTQSRAQHILRRIIAHANRKGVDIVNIADIDGVMPVYYVIDCWQDDKVKQLIYHGADIDACEKSCEILNNDSPLSIRNRLFAYGRYKVPIPRALNHIELFLNSVYGKRLLAKLRELRTLHRQEFKQRFILMLMVGKRMQSCNQLVDDVWRIVLSYIRLYYGDKRGFLYANTLSKDSMSIERVHPAMIKDCVSHFNYRCLHKQGFKGVSINCLDI